MVEGGKDDKLRWDTEGDDIVEGNTPQTGDIGWI
jgi:hypothetical protein